MSDQISLLSFYLAMVTLLSATFFMRLDSWYADVLTLDKAAGKYVADVKDGALRVGAEEIAYGSRRLELESSLPWRGLLLVGSFLVVLVILSIALGYTVDPAKAGFSIFTFIYFPGSVFLLLFGLGAWWFLKDGSRKLTNVAAILKGL